MIAEKGKLFFSFLFQSTEATMAAVPVLHIVQCHILPYWSWYVCDQRYACWPEWQIWSRPGDGLLLLLLQVPNPCPYIKVYWLPYAGWGHLHIQWPEKKRKEKTTPFGVNLLRSPWAVLYRAAQFQWQYQLASHWMMYIMISDVCDTHVIT